MVSVIFRKRVITLILVEHVAFLLVITPLIGALPAQEQEQDDE